MTAVGTPATRPGAASGRRYLLWAVIAVALLVVALVAGGPTAEGRSLDPASTDANGTEAMVDLLRESGADVSIRDTTPDPSVDIAVLLSDSTSQAMTDELGRWVDAGGTLVVADPRSSFAATASSRTTTFGVVEGPIERGDCTIRALAGIDRVQPSGGFYFDVPGSSESCFGGDKGSFVVDTPSGDGHLVSVGSASTFTNELLGRDDNAALAVALMAPREGTEVAVLYGMTPDGAARASGFGALVPTGVRLALVQLGIAFVLYTWWRGRRLGQPVREPQLVQIGGSELVGAVGNLMQQTHDPDRAARLLRADLRRRLAERLGLPPDSTPDVIAQVTAARSGADRDQVARAVTDVPVRSEDELLDLARDIDRIRTEVLHGTAP
ncbi:MAG: DUF4350 domain-containing protein [Acidimicrobiales bacterium]